MLQRIITFLFPSLCLRCNSEGGLLCVECQKDLPVIPFQVSLHSWALLHYHEKPSQQLIFALKFGGKKELSRTFAQLLRKCIGHISSQNTNIVIVPVPSSTKEKNARGYDHIALIARELSEITAIPFVDALQKTRDTKRQVEMLNRKERLLNLRQAFSFSPDADIAGKIVVVIDELTTTGATFEEARRTLLQGNPKEILGLALCH